MSCDIVRQLALIDVTIFTRLESGDQFIGSIIILNIFLLLGFICIKVDNPRDWCSNNCTYEIN